MENLKRLIGERIERLRGEYSQEWLQKASGVHRTIIGDIEKARTDYRINGLLYVLLALKSDREAVFSENPVEQAIHSQLTRLLRSGTPKDIQFILDMLDRLAPPLEGNPVAKKRIG